MTIFLNGHTQTFSLTLQLPTWEETTQKMVFKVLFDMYVYKGWEYHINQSHDMDSFQLCLAFLILLALSLRNFGMLIKKILMLLKEYEMGRL